MTETALETRPAVTDRQRRARPVIKGWLFVIAAMIFGIVIVGGATRLTESGLSIPEWQPVAGAVPPLSDAAWQEAFGKYKLIPEFRLENPGMSLDEFKAMYWWGWGHRLLGRLIGFVFFIPLVWLLATRRIERSLIPRLVFIFILGGLQGILGWYMVKSGLADRVDVSQYRLAAHLSLAAFIFGLVIWTAVSIGDRPLVPRGAHVELADTWWAGAIVVLVFLEIALGALVAGLRAGLIYNTWPLIDDAFIPEGLFDISPWGVNFFENILTVQFDHRMLAYVLVFAAVGHSWFVARRVSEGPLVASGTILAALVLAQVGLGIWTLLAVVPIDLALAHQALSFITLAMALYHLHTLVHARRTSRRSRAAREQGVGL